MDIVKKLWQAKNLVDPAEWTRHGFSWNKSYICSLYSKLAYLHIQDYEIDPSSRISLIPCIEFQESIRQQSVPGLRAILLESEHGPEDYFTVETPYAVAVGVRVGNIIFIAIRGTELLNIYDWRVNFNARKANPLYEDRPTIRFHKGFHSAIWGMLDTLYYEILERFGENNLIYVTGHSLGGALAAILHSLWSDTVSSHFPYVPRIADQLHITHSCYTFGMPRYGSDGAINYFPNPFHVYYEKDKVPAVPPKWLGYADCHTEYCLKADSSVKGNHRKGGGFIKETWSCARFTAKFASDHFMEKYIDLVSVRVSSGN